ncbi:MAG: helix-turn-helix transcriptional regulator [Acidimicrobiales bacterium]
MRWMSTESGAVIREARRRSGLSQAELARRAHVSQPVISAYESGRREPGLSMPSSEVRQTCACSAASPAAKKPTAATSTSSSTSTDTSGSSA